jgi:hypothetical protein
VRALPLAVATGLATLAGCATLASERPVAVESSARTCPSYALPIVASLVSSASTIAGTYLVLDGVADDHVLVSRLEAGVPIVMLGLVAATVTVVGFRSADDCRDGHAPRSTSPAWHSNGALGAR